MTDTRNGWPGRPADGWTGHPPDHAPPMLDMTPDGGFRTPQRLPLGPRLLAVAVLVVVLATMAVVALLFVWLLLALVPLVLGAGLVAWAVLRLRGWQARRRGVVRF